jgi:hypothetical protein
MVKDAGQAGDHDSEIEMTPEMISAGVLELARSNEDYESKEDIVRNIFVAMLTASKTSGCCSSGSAARYDVGLRLQNLGFSV